MGIVTITEIRTTITIEPAGMQYQPDRTTSETSHEAAFADYAILLSALDRLIADGDREIVRLQSMLAKLDGSDRASGCETASGVEGGALFLSRFGTERRPDAVIPVCGVRRRAA